MIRLADIRAAVARDGRAVVVLVTGTHGSSPREAGAAMLVTPSTTAGTVGGGTVEARAVELAHAMLAGKADAQTEVEFPLGPAIDQCCGGRMRLALALVTRESMPARTPGDGSAGRPLPLQGGGPGWGSTPDRPGATFELWPGGPALHDPAPPRHVVVYGAGHVGTALVRALAPLPFRVTWVDARAGACAGAPDGVETHETPLPEAIAETAGPDAFHVVLTHSHALDLEIVTAVMGRAFGFCGLIGSRTKRARFRRHLAGRGVASEAIDRLACPIGLPGLADKRPAVIAASTAAQLLQADAACRREAPRAPAIATAARRA